MKKTKKQLEHLAKKIKLLILDVDGVLTDGGIILDNEGNEFKVFNVRDGHGIKMLIRAGVKVAIISGRQSKVVERRAKELGIKDVYQKVGDKLEVYQRLILRYGLKSDEVAYMGDDIVDIPLLKVVGFPIAVADADEYTKQFALLVTNNKGGRGAVREVTDLILKAQGLWPEDIGGYLAY